MRRGLFCAQVTRLVKRAGLTHVRLAGKPNWDLLADHTTVKSEATPILFASGCPSRSPRTSTWSAQSTSEPSARAAQLLLAATGAKRPHLQEITRSRCAAPRRHRRPRCERRTTIAEGMKLSPRYSGVAVIWSTTPSSTKLAATESRYSSRTSLMPAGTKTTFSGRLSPPNRSGNRKSGSRSPDAARASASARETTCDQTRDCFSLAPKHLDIVP